MAEESYKEYLAARVLADARPVTYRLLSRALQVNASIAKQMLYDFYEKENAKKPKSVHATYLITGKKRDSAQTNGVNGRDGEDTNMRSSPFMSSMPEPETSEEEAIVKTHLVLVRQEELEKTKGDFEEVTSVHVYSLERGPIEDLNVLSTCNHEVATEYTNDDPLERWRMYGSIHNPHVKRRTAKYTPPAAATAPKATAKPTVKPTAKPGAVTSKKEQDTSKPNAREDSNLAKSTPQPTVGPSTLKRSDSKSSLKGKKTAGDIFKSFAKAKAKPKDAEKSKESTPAQTEDEAMQGMSEDDEDVNDEPEIKLDEEKIAASWKAREEREETLRKMMEEDDDEDMPDAPDASAAADDDSQDAPLDKPTESGPTATETAVSVQNGRRRGRRRVMKKKKVKDEDGYLVTKEEAVWESFSEDEPEPKKLKQIPAKPASTAKGKAAGKKGQGSIASFFKKA